MLRVSSRRCGGTTSAPPRAIEYSIARGGAEVVPPQRLELTRNISFDESQLLAKDREEEILRDAMAGDLADLVLRRLESLPAAQSDPSR